MMTPFAPASVAAWRRARVVRTVASAMFRSRGGDSSAIAGNCAPTDLQALLGTLSVVTISTWVPASACAATRPSCGS